MDYSAAFISSDKIRHLVKESLITIILDDNEVAFHPYIKNMEVGSYYIGSPLDGSDPGIRITYLGRRYDFYLLEDSYGAVTNITKAINIFARAFCDKKSAYKIYYSTTRHAGRLAIIDTNTGKTISSSFSNGSNIKDHVILLFKAADRIDT